MTTSPASIPIPKTFVALGDSFTEGLDDPSPTGNSIFRGWADRVAESFAAAEPRFRYANLAVRGRMLDRIIDEQLPRALELAPELVSLAGGTNDVLRPSVDLDRIAARFEGAVRQLRENGSQVVLFQSVDPTSRSRLIGRTLPRVKALTTIVEETAERQQCVLVRLWGEPIFADSSVWSDDRLHLSPEGHARVAGAVLEALGLGDHGWATAPGPSVAPTRRAQVAADARWARQHLVPWVSRRLRRVTSGDRVQPKLPDLAPVTWTDQTASGS
ncbi:MAG: SGNH/GDSL hydrolase family protein [Nocardioidaceae bacterium]